jgi:hypothetical protein
MLLPSNSNPKPVRRFPSDCGSRRCGCKQDFSRTATVARFNAGVQVTFDHSLLHNPVNECKRDVAIQLRAERLVGFLQRVIRTRKAVTRITATYGMS